MPNRDGLAVAGWNSHMPEWIMAGFWGLLAGSALLAGAAGGYWLKLPQRLIASVMAFGSGVLISALSFDLMDEAFQHGGLAATGFGFVAGAAIYTLADRIVAGEQAKHRKRSGQQQRSEKDAPGSGTAIAIGALLDGIPESIVIGLSLLAGEGVSLVAVAAVFISNIPEGLSSSAGMKNAGRSAAFVFAVWGGIAVASGLAAIVGYVAFEGLSPDVVAATTAVAAGAILAMLVDTMIPEAFETAHEYAELSGAGWCRQQYAASHSCVTGRVGIRANARVRSRDVQGVATARR
jgi:ZIP family zinc transporter